MEILQDVQIQKVPTKRRYIYQVLRDEILSHKLHPGSRLPPASKLASQFNVSYMTMHSALADLVHDGLMVRQKGKGTFTAPMAGKRTRPITSRLVMVLGKEVDMEACGFMNECYQLLQGGSQGSLACGAGLEVLSLPSSLRLDDLPTAVKQVVRYDAALFSGAQYAALIDELAKSRFPFVILGEDHPSASFVWYDKKAAVALAVQHLLAHGYRRIGFLGTAEGVTSEKFNMFKEMLAAQGVILDPADVQHCREVLQAHAAVRRLIVGRTPPEAVFVDNHHKASTLLSIAEEHGVSVPKDLAVIGYGADMPDHSSIPLTTVVIPYDEMGKEGAMLLDKLARGSVIPPVRRFLPPKLVIRKSCGCQLAEPSATGNLK